MGWFDGNNKTDISAMGLYGGTARDLLDSLRQKSNAKEIRETAAKGQANIEKGRQMALSGYEEAGKANEEKLSRFDDASAGRQREIKYGAAKGFAAAAGGGYTNPGAGSLTGLAQAGLDSEMAGIRQKTADEELRGTLTSDIAKGKIERGSAIGAMGSQAETQASAYADGVTEMTKIDNSYSFASTKARERAAVLAKIRSLNTDAADQLANQYGIA